MMARIFRAHGEFCATHPWEVIVATLTITACLLTLDRQQNASDATFQKSPTYKYCSGCMYEVEYNAADVIMMTFIRCLAVLYSYYQLRNLHKLESKYILGIAGLFTVFSSFVFTSTVINLLRSDVTDLKDALFFFLLLIDLSKAALLAQFALNSNNQEEVKKNIARGMSLLGPTITLDTVVETLVIGVGTLSGVQRLETLSCFACLSVLVNYMVFMTFYPACLSLILELSRNGELYLKGDRRQSLIAKALKEEEGQKPNPVVQRVKLIMSVGLMIVHAHSRWPFRKEHDDPISPMVSSEHTNTLNRTEDSALHGYIMKWMTISADHIVILILLLALTVKFIFFEDKDQLAEQLRMSEQRFECADGQEFCHGHSHSQLNSSLREKFSTPTMPFIRAGSFFLEQSDCYRKFGNSGREDVEVEHKEVQTDFKFDALKIEDKPYVKKTDTVEIVRDVTECLKIYNSELGASALSDQEVILLVKQKHIPAYQIEKAVNNPERGVGIRRQIIGIDGNFTPALDGLPYMNYDYSKVMGACCENVIGYVPIPVGIAGPLNLDGKFYHVPMATTEGCLVASTNRGSRALLKCGVRSRIVADGMTRGPVVRFPALSKASEAMQWMETPENFLLMKESFDSTSRFARLTKIHIRIAGRHLFIRFVAKTGDAMGMNMLSKGTENALKHVQLYFPEMEILSISGNFCTDKKPAAVNWIEGRGKSVVCEAIVPANIITTVLKTNVQALVDVNISKNMIGSAMAGSVGGFNAHAANIVTAIFIATGQDPAQNVGSSNCMTLMEPWGEEGNDLYVSCTMPSIEIGTVGGGTVLPAQAACLEMLGVKGANTQFPGENANQLAKIVCGTVLAGELSLLSALAAGHLVKSHLRHNRSSTKVSSVTSSSMSSLTVPPCQDS